MESNLFILLFSTFLLTYTLYSFSKESLTFRQMSVHILFQCAAVSAVASYTGTHTGEAAGITSYVVLSIVTLGTAVWAIFTLDAFLPDDEKSELKESLLAQANRNSTDDWRDASVLRIPDADGRLVIDLDNGKLSEIEIAMQKRSDLANNIGSLVGKETSLFGTASALMGIADQIAEETDAFEELEEPDEPVTDFDKLFGVLGLVFFGTATFMAWVV